MNTWSKEEKVVNMSSVPKMIMQTWKNHDVPDDWVASQTSIDKHMPDWSYVLMTDEDNRNFVEKYFPDFLPYYDDLPYGIQRADAVRYCWLYINGGVYMDLDYEMLEPIDMIFKAGGDLYLAASSNRPSCLTNSFMASRPRHQFWLDVIQAIKDEIDNPTWWAYGKHLKVMMSTGPGIVDKVARAGKYTYTVVPPGLLSPETLCQDTGKVGLMKPLRGCSWGGVDTRFYNFCFCNPWLAIFLLLLLIIGLIALAYHCHRRYKTYKYKVNMRYV